MPIRGEFWTPIDNLAARTSVVNSVVAQAQLQSRFRCTSLSLLARQMLVPPAGK